MLSTRRGLTGTPVDTEEVAERLPEDRQAVPDGGNERPARGDDGDDDHREGEHVLGGGLTLLVAPEPAEGAHRRKDSQQESYFPGGLINAKERVCANPALRQSCRSRGSW